MQFYKGAEEGSHLVVRNVVIAYGAARFYFKVAGLATAIAIPGVRVSHLAAWG